MNVEEFTAELAALREQHRSRDARMYKIATARLPGGLQLVYPDLFPTDGPYREPMVANMIDIAARDTSEVLAPPPTFNCASAVNASDSARRFADRRTKIAYGYFDASRLATALLSMADQYVTYGFAVGVVRGDPDRQTPVIQFLDPTGCYPVYDPWGNTKVLYEVRQLTHQQAESTWPELGARLRKDYKYSPRARVDVVRRHAADVDVIFSPAYPDLALNSAVNPVGKTLAHVFRRPGLSDEVIGQFDDVLAVQVAKARFALLTLEAAQKSVQAPLALPLDVQEINVGADATLRSATPQAIRRIGLEVPNVAFAQQAELDQELRYGARYPEVRTGNTDASVVTGRGVQALMTGFDTQIKTGQAVFAVGLSVLMGLCFAMDEALWPNVDKTVNGNVSGTPFTVKYRPSRDIRGDHTIDVQYGLMAGLQANQALVFGLQARGDRLISRDFLRRQMPFALDASDEESKVDVEELRDSLKSAYEATAQAIPALVAQGTSPAEVLGQMAAVIAARQKGVPMEDAIAKAFTPPEPPPPEPDLSSPPPEALAMAGGMPAPGPVGPSMADVGNAPPRQDVLQLMASLGRSGVNPTASVQRRIPL